MVFQSFHYLKWMAQSTIIVKRQICKLKKKRLFQTLKALILREKNSAVCLFKSFYK